MNRFFIIILLLITFSHSEALERPDIEFKIFQFPKNMIPGIDGNIDDWNIVPDDYIIGTDQLTDEKTPGRPMNRESLDVKVRVGWVKGLNRLYFCYEAYDDYWDMFYRRGDIFELLVDGDLSGKDVIINPALDRKENYFRFQGVLGQNYHIYTPPGEGRDWAMIWGCQPWINDLPWSNYAYNYDFKEGESGKLVLEFWITPFDYAPYDGPERAVVSKLVEDTIIGMTWTIIDYDAGNDHKNIQDDSGFWSISQHRLSYRDADTCVAFRLMPILPEFRKPIEAEWSFTVLDMDRRIVAFQDESYGDITSWLWNFDDGTTSTEQHPVHEFQRTGNLVITLNVEGPAGKAKRIKVWDVVIR
ncbi:PKD domain-containing protein [Candidatus Omnitrophota bacterium]